ncbi:hypothetical protein NA57DRAFT_82373 [Rhizodiscina lignyota]|uniref:KN homeodomain domain-containing protein n=1 Tax=Rhizodiscina lignyota TaxID=1504668 RepID=A0A9P4HZY9_9PEZI|nr:hypothetical protein NA57DRAFT_82373 [Rhizodiscina lignyota]
MDEQNNLFSYAGDHDMLGELSDFDSLHHTYIFRHELMQPPQTYSTSNGVFDLFGDDDELQEAGQNDLSEDDDLNVQRTDKLSPLPREVSNVPSSLQAVGSATSIASSNGGSRARLPHSARELLDKWIEINQHDPYLKPNDAEALAHLTSLTSQQVKTYIANFRARKPVTDNLLPPFPSGTSLVSIGSNTPLTATKQNRRRRRTSSAVSLRSSESQSFSTAAPRKYRCTWTPCTQSFSLRASFVSQGQSLTCAFCGKVIEVPYGTPKDRIGSEEHLIKEHKYLPCFDKPLSERSFTRKDKLKQHLQQVHKQYTPLTDEQEVWVWPTNESALFSCMFCEAEGMTWAQRMEHVAAHFESESAFGLPTDLHFG